VTLQLDETHQTATLTGSIAQPQGLSAASQGNFQSGLANGDRFIGWGALSRFSEFDSNGSLVLDAQLAAGFQTCRAYRLAWRGTIAATLPEFPVPALLTCMLAGSSSQVR
jgi:hypothetical protein